MKQQKRKPEQEIIYQIYPKSFQDTNHDGIGDLRGIIDHLDDLRDLGITMIWLCPIYPSPMEDNGYDVADYKAIHPHFGTMEDMDRLIEEAGKRDISLMLDLVLNHTSSRHKWFEKAVQDPGSKEHGYYIFEKGKEEPNNLRSVFGGSVWEKVRGRNEYYFHSFGKGQPDLNWENPALRQEIYQIIEFWKEKGIKAFRMDAINFIKKPEKWRRMEADGPDGRCKCTKVVRNHPGLLDYLHEMNEKCFKSDGIVTVGETAGLPYDQLEEYIGKNGCFTMVFDFRHADLDIRSGDEWFSRAEWKTADLKKRLEVSCSHIQKYGPGTSFLENHDQPRVTTKYLRKDQDDPYGKKMLGMLQMGLRGVPFLFQGQELGMINFERTDVSELEDISSIDQFGRARECGYSAEEALHFVNLRSRDNARVPYPWNEEKYGGFSDADPWLACNEQAQKRRICFENQKNDPDSVLSFYKKLISLRKSSDWSDTLNAGRIRFEEGNEEVIAFTRQKEEKELLVLCSFADHPVKTLCRKGTLILDNYKETDMNVKVDEEGMIILRPFEAMMIETEKRRENDE